MGGAARRAPHPTSRYRHGHADSSRFLPDRIDVKAGDEVTIHVTNVEQTTDMIHGLGIIEHDMNVVVDPGETKTVKFVAGKPGVYPFYCTNFCSALHQEMQGYLAVKP